MNTIYKRTAAPARKRHESLQHKAFPNKFRWFIVLTLIGLGLWAYWGMK